MPEPIHPRDILGNAEVRKLCGTVGADGKRRDISRSTLIDWRRLHGFPEPIRVLEQGELWSRKDVKAWLASSRPVRGPKPRARPGT